MGNAAWWNSLSMVALFDLQKTIKYKQKWGVDQQRTGLVILRSYLSALACAEPPLLHNEQLSRWLATDLMELRGRALKDRPGRSVPGNAIRLTRNRLRPFLDLLACLDNEAMLSQWEWLDYNP